MVAKSPKYRGLTPASERARSAARGASKQQNTKPELILRKALWHAGLRFRKNVSTLPGKPDIVFRSRRIVIFCDGDFWHGKDWVERKAKLSVGTNANYWIAKIERNIERDLEHVGVLNSAGWTVLRIWESDIIANVEHVVKLVQDTMQQLNFAIDV